MKRAIGFWILVFGCGVASASSAPAQGTADTTAPKPYELQKLFSNDSVVRFTLTTNFRALSRSRSGESRYQTARLTYSDTGAAPITIPLRVRARGHWRRANCDMPPVLLNFWADSSKKTLFARLDRGRLVVHCRNDAGYEQYILQEFQLYRVYNLLTPFSHRARLAQVTYVDSATGRQTAVRHGFILEDDDDMAARNGVVQADVKGAKVGDLDPYTDALVGLFQYMIGATDWSVAGLHNIQLVRAPDGTVRAVAYDFDWSGAVNASYARPDARLPIATVRQRLFRGYCAPPGEFARAVALFNEKKPAIYALYSDHIGKLMNPRVVQQTVDYFDDFYETINEPRRLADLIRSCKQAQ
ncbi:MAG TPA: hypothetical protein VMY38_07620 [Gemmatimonadaceae bacterium]|nr:hypothetical protein [Gemmatimonadaceae bacterium]